MLSLLPTAKNNCIKIRSKLYKKSQIITNILFLFIYLVRIANLAYTNFLKKISALSFHCFYPRINVTKLECGKMFVSVCRGMKTVER